MNVRRPYRVMLSSTFEDLQREREEIIRLMGREDLHEVAMENSPARSTLSVRESSMQMVDAADAYIGIIGYRYGSRVVPEGLSLTELEWRRARQRGIPCCFLLMSPKYPVPMAAVQAVSDKDRESLAAFRRQVETAVVCAVFSDDREFALNAMHSLVELRRTLDGAYWGSAVVLDKPAPGQSLEDEARLELLCDRVHAAMGFEDVLEGRSDPLRPGCLLVFGEDDQAPGDFFERMADILGSPPYRKRFPDPATVHVPFDRLSYDLQEDIGVHILRTALRHMEGDAGGAEDGLFKALYATLKRRRVALCLIRGIVHVESHAQAGWWIERFKELRDQMTLQLDGPQIVLAIAIQYPRGRWSLRRSRDMTRFFRLHFPAAFSEQVPRRSRNVPALEAAGLTVRRLPSVTRVDVSLWLEEPRVRRHIERARISRQKFFQPFERSREKPMWDVLEHLRGVLTESSSARTPK